MNAINWIANPGVTRENFRGSQVLKSIVSIASAISAGAIVGGLLGLAGSEMPDGLRADLAWLSAFCGFLFISAAAVSRISLLPQLNRQTTQRLLDRGPYWWAALNSVQLAAGFTTRLGTWLWYVVPFAAVWSAEPAWGSCIYGSYALARLLSVVLLAWLSASRASVDVAAVLQRSHSTVIRLGDGAFAAFCASILIAGWQGG